MEDTIKIAKKAKILNILFIVWTIIMFICYNLSNLIPIDIFFLINWTLTFILMILSIVIFIKMKKNKIQGDIPLLITGILTFLFAISGLMLGIIVLVLSAMSLRKISEFIQESEI